MKPDLFVPADDYGARMDTLIERVREADPHLARDGIRRR